MDILIFIAFAFIFYALGFQIPWLLRGIKNQLEKISKQLEDKER